LTVALPARRHHGTGFAQHAVPAPRGVAGRMDVISSGGDTMLLNFIIWLVIGGVIGWLAGLVMGNNQGVILNVIVGIVGAFLGGLIFSMLGLGGSNINSGDFSLPALVVSFLGAVVLVALLNLLRRGSTNV
jgi:uncharacterized membrane protein YeaQ/YmgE (transglycosylase-associated protein family)